MSYRFLAGEPESSELRRCAGEQLDRAISELSKGVKSDPVRAVHDARKALKRERSLLRLGRGSLGSSDRRTINVALRDAGRRLSGARDAEVMIQAVDDLAEQCAGQLPKKTFDAIRAHLDGQARDARVSLMDSSLTGEVLEELNALRLGVDHWRLRSSGWAAIGEGLQRSYARGRKAYRRAEAEPSVENLHEWRKRAKDLWYQLRLLKDISPGTMRGQAKEAHRLSDLLGDDHDLAVLRQSLLTSGAAIPVDLDSVIALLDHRRAQLQAEASIVGARLYAETPKAFTERLRRYWKAWRSEPQLDEARQPIHLPGRTPVNAAS